MARLTSEQWEIIRAEYEIGGTSVSDLARQHGVSKGAISQKIGKEGWKLNSETKQLSDKKVNAIMALAEVEAQTKQNLSPTERRVLDDLVEDEISFRLKNDSRMETVVKSAMQLLSQMENAAEMVQVMRILVMQREAFLGKTLPKRDNPDDAPITEIRRIIVDTHH